jgi:hypothetical protein
MTIDNNNDIKALSNMSITELKQLLSCVNQDLKSIKRAEKIAANNVPSEYDIANNIAKSFTGKVYPKPVENRRLKEDIQIQQDILDYLNNGKHIICHTPRKSKNSIKFKPLSVLSTKIVSL